MAVSGGGSGVLPELLQVMDPLLNEFRLEPAAERLVTFYLRRATSVLVRQESFSRDASVAEAQEGLARVAEDIAQQLRAYDLATVDRDTLVTLFQAHCPFPPFCHEGDGGELLEGADSGGTYSTTPEPMRTTS